MGYDINRFVETPDEELLCPICNSVLEDPVQTESCEHAFCRRCIETWLEESLTCPVDRESVDGQRLVAPPRILRNLLGRLSVRCMNAPHGCPASSRLDLLDTHERECDYNPDRPIECTRGCGIRVPKNDYESHSCIQSLRAELGKQEEKNGEAERRLDEYSKRLSEVERELVRVNAALGTMIGGDVTLQSSSAAAAIVSSTAGPPATDELETWARSLSRAKVTRWGGMISTPDAVLQSAIRRALLEAECPYNAIPGLIERAHERLWPSALLSLETRQANRAQYLRYNVRRIPGRQAVLILASENRHMPVEFILQPCMVIIFASGVESRASVEA